MIEIKGKSFSFVSKFEENKNNFKKSEIIRKKVREVFPTCVSLYICDVTNLKKNF